MTPFNRSLQMSQLRKLSVTLCFITIFIVGCSGREENCFSRNGPVCRAATKTPYRCVAPEGGGRKLPKPEQLPAGCEAKKVWLLARHGTRYIISVKH